MGRVLAFARSNRVVVRELPGDPQDLLHDLIEALQVLTATNPDVIVSMQRYARHLADDELARLNQG